MQKVRVTPWLLISRSMSLITSAMNMPKIPTKLRKLRQASPLVSQSLICASIARFNILSRATLRKLDISIHAKSGAGRRRRDHPSLTLCATTLSNDLPSRRNLLLLGYRSMSQHVLPLKSLARPTSSLLQHLLTRSLHHPWTTLRHRLRTLKKTRMKRKMRFILALRTSRLRLRVKLRRN